MSDFTVCIKMLISGVYELSEISPDIGRQSERTPPLVFDCVFLVGYTVPNYSETRFSSKA